MALKTDAMVLGAVVVAVIVGAVALAFMTPQGQQIIGAAGGGLIASILGFVTGIWNGITGWFNGLWKAINPANWKLVMGPYP